MDRNIIVQFYFYFIYTIRLSIWDYHLYINTETLQRFGEIESNTLYATYNSVVFNGERADHHYFHNKLSI